MKDEPSILLVDDSENDLFLMRRAFQKADFAITLHETRDGREAIAYLKGEGPYADRVRYPLPTLMVLDLNLPQKNGFQVLKWLRDQPGLRRLTVLVLTTSMREEDVEQALDLGANWFIMKPPEMEGLVAVVRALRNWMHNTRFASLEETAKP